ncbi:MAG: septal ring lytic transglycosylase RlpA family protein [Bacteroidota bacterium]
MKAITCGFLLLCSTLLVAQEFGLASYYADSFQGISTASGEPYDKTKFTCAHNSHPFGTMLKVTNIDNSKSVKVRVNDRGPFIKGRIVDLSRVAAEKLDLIRAGTAEVRVELASNGKGSVAAVPTAPKLKDTTKKGGTAKSTASTTKKSSSPAKATRPSTYVDKNVPKDKPVAKSVASSPKATAKAATSTATKKGATPSASMAKSYNKYGLYQIQVMTPKTRGYGVQVASFASYDNVMSKVAELQGKWFDEILVKSEPSSKGQPVYKVILGNFDQQASANNYKKNLKAKHGLSGFVVNLSD